MRSTVLSRAFCLALVLLAAPLCIAAPATYTGTAPVNSQSDADRAGALKTALANVVIEQTGDSGVLSRPDVASAVAQAEHYVLQYQYRTNGGGADDTAKMTLVAEFDSAAVDKMLQRFGLGSTDQAAAATEPSSDATVWIAGIRSADDYARVMGYLGRNNFVHGIHVMQAQGDGMLVKLSLATDLAHFIDAVGLERTLAVSGAAPLVKGSAASLTLVQ